MIKLTDVSFSYGEKSLFSGFSAAFSAPEHWAILGPSGCGKTTLLSLMGGLLIPSSGQVENDSRTAFCFQEDRLLPWYTVLQNVLLAVDPRLPKAERLDLARFWLEQTGLLSEQNAYPASLSGGMKRRTALTRTLSFNGDALLLDEPFRALDEALHEQMLRLILESSKDKLLILVTHDERDARGLNCLRLGTK